MIYHRSLKFIDAYQQVSDGLKYFFQTDSDVLILNSSGTGAMEAAISNFFSPGDKIFVAINGKFSERWKIIGQRFNLEVLALEMPWGKAIPSEQLLEKVEANGDIKGIFLTYCETSSGELLNLETLSRQIRSLSDALLIVDGISAIPTMPFFMDKWGIDIAIAASQKGLGLLPGLAFIAVNSKAWVAAELAELPRFYFDLIKYRQADRLAIGSPFTPSIHHILAANQALKTIREKSLTAIWKEREEVASYFRGEIEKRGIRLLPENPSNSLTVLDFSQNKLAGYVIEALRENYKIVVSGGQGKLRGKIIRVGHMANVSKKELDRFLNALDEILEEANKR